MSVTETFNRFMLEGGETMTLSRYGEGSAITVKGKRIRMHEVTEDLGGTAVQSRMWVRIGNVELAASSWATKAPKRADSIVIGGRTRAITDVRTISVGEDVTAYEFETAG